MKFYCYQLERDSETVGPMVFIKDLRQQPYGASPPLPHHLKRSDLCSKKIRRISPSDKKSHLLVVYVSVVPAVRRTSNGIHFALRLAIIPKINENLSSKKRKNIEESKKKGGNETYHRNSIFLSATLLFFDFGKKIFKASSKEDHEDSSYPGGSSCWPP